MILSPDSIIAKRFLHALEHIQCGRLIVIDPHGKRYEFQGSQPGPHADWTIHDWRVVRHALLRGDIGLGEDFTAGLWETSSVETLFSLLLLNMDRLESYAHGDWLRRFGFNCYNRLVRRNSKSGSKDNIREHYDVGNDFYRLWLDETMTYSSAIFNPDTPSLASAQHSKYQRILEHIDETASSVLEVGCGWGGFAEAAAISNRMVTGLTISPAQHDYAKQRLGDKADIRLQDYRETEGKFDAIVSIEMFEAVGERYWPVYFNTIRERLKHGAKAVIQTITIADDQFEGYSSRSDYIRHYVFPGGMLPSLKRFKDEAAKAGLQCLEVFSFGQDYARTLREWLKRFDEKHSEIRNLGYSEAFIRNWQFYLGICAAAFAVERTNVVQVDLTHA